MRSRIPLPWQTFALLVALALLLPACAHRSPASSGTEHDQALPSPPVAEKRDHVHTEHGVNRPDPYYWMKDRDDPSLRAYLQAENAYTQAQTAHLAELRQRLFQEMLGHIQEADLSVPVRKGDWWYYTRTEEGRAYPIHCRRRGSMEQGQEQVILDENQLAEGQEYLDLGVFQVSPNQRFLAFSIDTTGAERHTLRFKDLAGGDLLPEAIENTAYSLAWALDDQTVFYVTRDQATRPYRVYRHSLGTDPAQDTLVYEEKDERYTVDLRLTRSEAFVVMDLESSTTTEVRVLGADNPMGDFRVLQPRHQGMMYRVDHQGERFFIVTNDHDGTDGRHDDGAMNFKLMEAPQDSNSRSQWKELIPHRPQVLLETVDAFDGYLVMSERENGFSQVRVMDLATGGQRVPEWPEPTHSVWLSSNPDFHARGVIMEYTSLVTPSSFFFYSFETGDMQLLKEQPVPAYDRRLYTSERLFARAPDGVQVPISVVYRSDLDRKRAGPLYLEGYGAYGLSDDPYFMPEILSLLDRGMVFAMAHVRGGGEMGRQWYVDGKLLNKKNTFTDFIACAEFLVDEGWTTAEQLVISGGSAGGLLIGAVINMRPELFHVAVADVPFVDAVTTMLDSSIPLTTEEWEEWGDPHDEQVFDYMLSYSPYDNVGAHSYPNLLITSGLNDPRVMYWEPTKWAARLRDLKTDQNLLLLKTEMGSGHMGRSGRYGYLEETAFEFAFVLDRLGMTES